MNCQTIYKGSSSSISVTIMGVAYDIYIIMNTSTCQKQCPYAGSIALHICVVMFFSLSIGTNYTQGCSKWQMENQPVFKAFPSLLLKSMHVGTFIGLLCQHSCTVQKF